MSSSIDQYYPWCPPTDGLTPKTSQPTPETAETILGQLRRRKEALEAELFVVNRMIAAGEGK